MQPGATVTKVVNDPQQILQITGDVGMALLRDSQPVGQSMKRSSPHCL